MILVTGGAGFVGSNLIAGLEERGHRGIAVCDRLGDGDRWRNLAKRAVGTVFAPERLTGFLDEAGAAIEAVFHIGFDDDDTDVDRMLEANYHTAAELWAWCAGNGVRFFYASTAETYGDGSAGFDDDIDEAALARLAPLTARGWTGHMFDRAVARTVAAGSRRPPQWAGLKLFDVYGPNEYHEEEPSLAASTVARRRHRRRLDPDVRRDSGLDRGLRCGDDLASRQPGCERPVQCRDRNRPGGSPKSPLRGRRGGRSGRSSCRRAMPRRRPARGSGIRRRPGSAGCAPLVSTPPSCRSKRGSSAMSGIFSRTAIPICSPG